MQTNFLQNSSLELSNYLTLLTLQCWIPDYGNFTVHKILFTLRPPLAHHHTHLRTQSKTPICFNALIALTPAPQTGSTSYVLIVQTAHMHRDAHTDSMGCAPNLGRRGKGVALMVTLSCVFISSGERSQIISHDSILFYSSDLPKGNPKMNTFIQQKPQQSFPLCSFAMNSSHTLERKSPTM